MFPPCKIKYNLLVINIFLKLYKDNDLVHMVKYSLKCYNHPLKRSGSIRYSLAIPHLKDPVLYATVLIFTLFTCDLLIRS